MNLENIGQVIAARTIRTNDGENYVVKIGLPQQFPDSTDFYCPHQIDSDQRQGEVSYSTGIDSVQVLQLALKHVGGLLSRMNEKRDGTLRWDGDEHGDLGFPLPEAW